MTPTAACVDMLLSVSVLKNPLQIIVTLILFARLMGFHIFTSSHQWCYCDSPPVNIISVLLGWKLTSVFQYCIMLGEVLSHHTHHVQKVRSPHKNIRMYCCLLCGYVLHTHGQAHTHILWKHKQNHTHTHPALQELKKRKGVDFPLTSVPANHTAGDLKSVPFQANQRWWWAHTSFISGPWFAAAVWHCERSSLCSSHGILCHTHWSRQSGRQPALFGSCWQKNFAVLVLWHLLSIRTIINYSRPQECVLVSKRMCVWVCAHVCVYHSVCGHEMLSSDLWGATFHPLLSQNLLFLSASWNMGSFLWIFSGHEYDASFMDSVQLIYTELSSEGSSGWSFLLARAVDLFLFL